MPDFRLDYLSEARKCLRHVEGQKPTQLEFWANLVGTIANGIMACVPDSVVSDFEASQVQQKAARKHIKERLEG